MKFFEVHLNLFREKKAYMTKSSFEKDDTIITKIPIFSALTFYTVSYSNQLVAHR
jgi:hypothetical protein